MHTQEVAQRLHAIKVKQVLGGRKLKSPGHGAGSRRGMYDETRAAVNAAALSLGHDSGASSTSTATKRQQASSSVAAGS
jgi:hypothetical protein